MFIDDDVLDMSDVLDEWSRSHVIKTVETVTVDFEKQTNVIGRNQECVVQSAEKDKLTVEEIDYSLEYLLIHSSEKLGLYEFVEFNGKDYKIITPQQWSGYGYSECIAEEVKKPVMPVDEWA